MRSNDLDFDLPGPPAAFLAALAAAVEAWGGEWQADDDGGGGQLALPVVFGLKRGVQVGRIDVAATPAGTHLHWRCEASHLEVHRAAVAILGLAAVALLPALAWPFHPPLMALLPFAAVTGLIAWWAVISKLPRAARASSSRSSASIWPTRQRRGRRRSRPPRRPHRSSRSDTLRRPPGNAVGRRGVLGGESGATAAQAAETGKLSWFFHNCFNWGRTGFDGEHSGSGVRVELALVKRQIITANDNFALAA